MKYEELTGKIIGCATRVHSMLGNGFQEIIYQRALAIEMNLAGLKFEMEKEMKIYYRGHQVGTRRSDFFVEEKIMVEIKAKSNLDDVNLNQAMNYPEAYNMEIGLLINFGAKSLQFKRVHNNKIIKDSTKINQVNQENQVNQG
ncbi:MAG TPA: GxxExxY protein [Ignavibacteria bacterium]|nr:GxxExxY protein [Ignavibacteria bacterium]